MKRKAQMIYLDILMQYETKRFLTHKAKTTENVKMGHTAPWQQIAYKTKH